MKRYTMESKTEVDVQNWEVQERIEIDLAVTGSL